MEELFAVNSLSVHSALSGSACLLRFHSKCLLRSCRSVLSRLAMLVSASAVTCTQVPFGILLMEALALWLFSLLLLQLRRSFCFLTLILCVGFSPKRQLLGAERYGSPHCRETHYIRHVLATAVEGGSLSWTALTSRGKHLREYWLRKQSPSNCLFHIQ